MIRSATFTGSRVYGRPTKKSDLDLVLLLESSDFSMLLDTCEKIEHAYDTGDECARSLRFGNLNVICMMDPVAYGVFVKATDKLCRQKKDQTHTMSRNHAVKVMRNLRKKHGIEQ